MPSPEGAKLLSPPRKRWVRLEIAAKPQRGDIKVYVQRWEMPLIKKIRAVLN